MSIRFKSSSEKILETLLWIANQKPGIDHYHVVKVLFSADKEHLNKYGRPIIGDEYVAMRFGPVPSVAYDFIKKNNLNLSEEELSNLEEGIEFQDDGRIRRLYPIRDCSLSLFSRTDIECLQNAFKECCELSFEDLKKQTHKEPAWQHARESSLISRVPEMQYEHLIDEENPNKDEIIDNLQEIADDILL